jgi:membrane protein implicated in regulation of membrane protease activity
MAKAGQAPRKGATQKSLIVLAVLFLLIGGAVMDPMAGIACFVLAGGAALVAVFSGSGWPRFLAVALLIAAAALVFSNVSAARQHHQNYRSNVRANSGERCSPQYRITNITC